MLQDRSCHQKLVSSSVQKKQVSRQETPSSVKQTQKQKQGSWYHGPIKRVLRARNTAKYENYHEKSTSILGRMQHNPKKHENYQEKSTSKKLSRRKSQKGTSFIVKTPFKSIPEQRKVRKLPRKVNIEELEEPKKYENYCAKPVSDPFKSTADQRKVRELQRKVNIEEVEEPETARIHIQNLRPTTRAKPKLPKFTYKTNMQARNQENSYEFRPPPRSSHPAFYPYRKNPKC